MEVYLDCPVSICAQRDYKGNYAKAFQGLYENFIGVTEPYQLSEHVDLTLYTGRDSLDRCSSILYSSVIDFLKLGEAKDGHGTDHVTEYGGKR
jgi:adenylylsulfate kinase-like enzyme